jgi:hypothetical protein
MRLRMAVVGRQADTIAELIAETRELDALGQRIQGSCELLVEEDEIDALVSRYQDWLARALAAVPEEFAERLREEHKGAWHSAKIKQFLEAPGEVSLIHKTAEEGTDVSAFPYWQHPFETTFRAPLLTQRQILTEARQQLLSTGHNEEVELVERICRGFGEFLVPLGSRQRGRPSFVIEDEYDVQDVLHGLLRIFFDDVRPEDFSSDRAGARSRIDFVLRSAGIVVEAKMTRSGLGAAKVGEQLIVDIERYRSHQACNAIVALVYDPEKHITNRRALENDLSGERDGLVVRVVVVQ